MVKTGFVEEVKRFGREIVIDGIRFRVSKDALGPDWSKNPLISLKKGLRVRFGFDGQVIKWIVVAGRPGHQGCEEPVTIGYDFGPTESPDEPYYPIPFTAPERKAA